MKKTTLHIILSLIALLSLNSCNEEITIFDKSETSDGQEVELALSLHAVDSQHELEMPSRADVDDDQSSKEETIISDVWLIEYDSIGGIIGSPRYFNDPESMTAVTVILPTSDSKYHLVAIANTGNDGIREKLASCNFKDLWKLSYGFNSDPSYKSTITGQKSPIIMNGSTELYKGMTNITIPMFRNIAKITVDITNKASSKVNIKTVRLCKLPTLVSYADQMLEKNSTAIAENSSLFNMPEIPWASVADSDMDTDTHMNFVFYCPRNMRGNSNSMTQYDKNKNAPSGSTYLEIIAEDAVNKTALRYRFYLGTNMINNHDIKSNHHYHLPIVISSKGNVDMDSRVEEFKSKKIAHSSNCYILTYKALGDQDYTCIPLDRINHFWTNSLVEDPDFTLHSTTKWIAEVIWQDSPNDIFHFCDKDGNDKENNKHFYEGEGFEEVIPVKPTGNGPGNVLIGVRRADMDGEKEGYLWSWHLWITDYNPYPNAVLSDNRYYYEVDGEHSSVHRYDSDYWKNNLPAASGIYIMDRNLGAYTSSLPDDKITEDNEAAELYKYMGVYYHLGRKDPWPRRKSKLYKYTLTNGEESELAKYNYEQLIKTVHLQTLTLANSVRHPNWFYNDNNKWLEGYNYLNWDIPGWTNYKGKSLFDPSPLGWRLPLKEECPRPDNFLDIVFTLTWGFYARLNNMGDNEDSNFVNFPSTRGQYAYGQTTPSMYDGSHGCKIVTNSPTSMFRPTVWHIQQTSSKNVISIDTQNPLCANPTRLIRDPSQD